MKASTDFAEKLGKSLFPGQQGVKGRGGHSLAERYFGGEVGQDHKDIAPPTAEQLRAATVIFGQDLMKKLGLIR